MLALFPIIDMSSLSYINLDKSTIGIYLYLFLVQIGVKLYIYIHNEVRDFDRNSSQPSSRQWESTVL
jgi:hypothetical protein